MNDVVSNPAIEALTPVPFAVAVFGRDEQGKAHASRFEPADAALAERATGLMGMRVLRLDSTERQVLGAKLPAGRIFEKTGRAFVPFVKAEVFAQLDADPAAFRPEPPADASLPPAAPRKAKGGRPARASAAVGAGAEDAAGGPATPPADQAAITVGHRVLAAELNEPEFWYLAEVTALKEPDMLQLRWVSAQYANEPPFVRHREHLALLPPALASVAR